MKPHSWILILFFLTSCDAMLIMPYQVKNKTWKMLPIHITDYPTAGMFSSTVDTILILPPREVIVVGYANGLGFPWDTKKLYKLKPGMQNFIILDSTLSLDYSDRSWKYRKKSSVYRIK